MGQVMGMPAPEAPKFMEARLNANAEEVQPELVVEEEMAMQVVPVEPQRYMTLSREILAAYLQYADTFQDIEFKISQSMLQQVAIAKELFDKIRNAYFKQAFIAGATAVVSGGFGIAAGVTQNKGTQEMLAAVSRAINPLGEIPKNIVAGNQSRDIGDKDLVIQHGLTKLTEEKRKFGEEDNQIANRVGDIIRKDYESLAIRV